MAAPTIGTRLFPIQTHETDRERLGREILVLIIIAILVGLGTVFLIMANRKPAEVAAKVVEGDLVLNRLGDVVEWRAEAVAGWTEADMLGRSFTGLMPPDKRETCRQKIVGYMDRGLTYTATCWLENKDGGMVPITFTISELDRTRYAAKVMTR